MPPVSYCKYIIAVSFLCWQGTQTCFSQQPGFIPKKLAGKKDSYLDSNGWKASGMFILNINQSAQSDWGTGGENFLLGVNAVLNKTIHHLKNKYTFDLYTDIEIGFVEATSFKKIRKTTDRVDITGEIEHSIGNNRNFNYAILGNINTQVFSGHNYFTQPYPKNSSFLSPGKFLLSAGLDFKRVRENSYLSVFVSPLTFRWVTKIDDDFYSSYKFGVDSFKRITTEIGAYLSLHYNNVFSKNVRLTSRLDLYSNYKRQPQNIDLLLNNILSVNLGKVFAFTFLFDVIYDHDYKRRTQIQEISGLGLRLKL